MDWPKYRDVSVFLSSGERSEVRTRAERGP